MAAVSFLAHMSLIEGRKQRWGRGGEGVLPEEEFQNHVLMHVKKVILNSQVPYGVEKFLVLERVDVCISLYQSECSRCLLGTDPIYSGQLPQWGDCWTNLLL